jgi:hypothetical protein
MLFSYEKYIIVGNYKNSINASNAVKRLKKLSIKDTKLKNLIKKNSLKIISKKIKKYNIVAVQTLNRDVNLLETLKVLRKYYNGPYVLINEEENNVSKKNLHTTVKNKIEIKPATVDSNEIRIKPIILHYTESELKPVTFNYPEIEEKPVIVDYTWDKTAKKWVESVPKQKK